MIAILEMTKTNAVNKHCFRLALALWIMAAKSELEDRNSSESARHLFLRALRFHPNDKKVYQEVKDAKYLLFIIVI